MKFNTVSRMNYPKDCSLPGFSVHGISQARILKWVVISSSRNLPYPGTEPMSPIVAGGFFTMEPPGKPYRSTTKDKGKLGCLQGIKSS